jgi:hypothetical protein
MARWFERPKGSKCVHVFMLTLAQAWRFPAVLYGGIQKTLSFRTRSLGEESASIRRTKKCLAAAYPRPFVENASDSNVFCSISCAPAEPVAGLALEDRFTDSTGRSSAIWRNRGIM